MLGEFLSMEVLKKSPLVKWKFSSKRMFLGSDIYSLNARQSLLFWMIYLGDSCKRGTFIGDEKTLKTTFESLKNSIASFDRNGKLINEPFKPFRMDLYGYRRR